MRLPYIGFASTISLNSQLLCKVGVISKSKMRTKTYGDMKYAQKSYWVNWAVSWFLPCPVSFHHFLGGSKDKKWKEAHDYINRAAVPMQHMSHCGHHRFVCLFMTFFRYMAENVLTWQNWYIKTIFWQMEAKHHEKCFF